MSNKVIFAKEIVDKNIEILNLIERKKNNFGKYFSTFNANFENEQVDFIVGGMLDKEINQHLVDLPMAIKIIKKSKDGHDYYVAGKVV